MRKSHIDILLLVLLVAGLVGCSTKKNTGMSRFYHAMTARFNIYFNGNEAYKAGVKELGDGNEDLYLEQIPLHPIGNKKSAGLGKGNFDIAIEKSQKAIKLHSIKKKPKKNPNKSRNPQYKKWLASKEFNPFLKNAWLLMGKAQFQTGDFTEAASTFSYVARLYANDDKVRTEANLWLAECYSQLDWFYDSEDLLNKANNDSLPASVMGQYKAAMGNLLLRQGRFQEAIPYLESTAKKERSKLQKARLYYIIGQAKQHLGDDAGAYAAFGRCAKLNAKYELTLNAKIRQTEVIPSSEIPKALKRMNRMAKQGKNKDFMEQIYYAVGNIHLSRNDTVQAIESYEKGRESENSSVEKGVLLLRLGDLYWARNEYSKAQECYQEALGMLTSDYDGYDELNKRSMILDELVGYAEEVALQDSLQRLAKMPEEKQLEIINKIIEEVKRQEEEQRKEEERQKLMAQREENMGEFASNRPSSQTTPAINTGDKSWYFYNQQLVTQGKNEFVKKWGRRKLEDDWRRSNKTIINMDEGLGYNYDEPVDSLGNPIELTDTVATDTAALDNKNPEYYLQQLPVTEEQIAESNNVIKDGLFNLGKIYKDKLEDYPNALANFERLYTQYPDFEMMDEVYYNLYLMYMLWDRPDDAEAAKATLIALFPDSKYALTLSDPDYLYNIRYGKHLEDSLYAETYNAFRDGDIDLVEHNYEVSATKYAMGQHRAKFMFLYAMARLNRGDQETFLEVLKAIVQDYPENDVTEIAQGILKGNEDGRILQGAMLGSIWSRRKVDWGGEESDSTQVEQFSDERNTPFIFVLAFEPGKVDENMLLFTMANYNFSSFVIKSFDLSFQTENGIRMLVTSEFTNFNEARQYWQLLYSNEEMARKLSGIKAIIISRHNFDLLNQYYSFDDYDAFFKEKFSSLPLPEFEGIIFDTPDYDELEELDEESGYAEDEEIFLN